MALTVGLPLIFAIDRVILSGVSPDPLPDESALEVIPSQFLSD
jgi:hypothetical protein